MNRQINYIIYAFGYVALLVVGYLLIEKLLIVKSETAEPITEIQSNKSPELSSFAAKGKILFLAKCASCHALFKDMTGPGIIGFEQRGPWTERKNIYDWIRNPAAFIEKNEYAKELKAKYGVLMTAFPDLTEEEIDAICDYIKESAQSVENSMPLALK
jgi:cytochrome c2